MLLFAAKRTQGYFIAKLALRMKNRWRSLFIAFMLFRLGFFFSTQVSER
jgi:hypothetical protein